MKRYRSVDAWLADQDAWKEEVSRLRDIIQSTGLQETVKWSAPCYTLDGKNVVGLAAFRDYFGIWFHQGVFLSDPEKVLINAQEGKTRALRQWRFRSKKEIRVRLIRSYLKEAMDQARQGVAIKPRRITKTAVPVELRQALADNRQAATAFESLTPGKQREYAGYIAEAKRAETRSKRIEKILPMIQSGVGLNDKYR